MTHTDPSGIDSHGMSMPMSYEELWRSERLRLDAQGDSVIRPPSPRWSRRSG
ncbi:hypothetical protein [Pseudonocardia sp. ICBG1034]|uniref:hypothetical protein n=1 Tax=Pseudonocardia sp. ICBG1034 TaxID=2844381 RepID=UPI001CCB2585|nr:hypothetical protein [Pseudonocardia sp. ICBG1034]